MVEHDGPGLRDADYHDQVVAVALTPTSAADQASGPRHDVRFISLQRTSSIALGAPWLENTTNRTAPAVLAAHTAGQPGAG